jgi:hypothetical protein
MVNPDTYICLPVIDIQVVRLEGVIHQVLEAAFWCAEQFHGMDSLWFS